MSDAMRAETVQITGHGGDTIEAYLAQPMDGPPAGGVVVIHHMPGYDEGTKEITRTFAAAGYLAICPNLYYREAPGASPDDAAATARAQGVCPIRAWSATSGGRSPISGPIPCPTGKWPPSGTAPAAASRSSPPAASTSMPPSTATAHSSSPPARGRSPQGRAHRPPGQEPVLPPARAVRCRGQVPLARRGRRAREGAHGRGQGVRVPHLRGGGPCLLRHRPAQLSARGRRRGLAAGSGTSSAATWATDDGSHHVHVPDHHIVGRRAAARGPRAGFRSPTPPSTSITRFMPAPNTP